MKLTVAICTWNRAELLRRTLDSLTRTEPNSRGDWELVLIDNNSTDRTTEVCRAFERQLPIHYTKESVQGHAASRNRALSVANGQFILWTDDDVEVSAGWLGAYRNAFERFPDASFFGGPIELRFLQAVPRWLSLHPQEIEGVFARRQLGDQPILLDKEHLPFGANFATRTDVQRQFLFRTEFGRVAADVRGYDEIDVLGRMIDRGHHGRWVPDARVDHLIPPSRTTIRYVRDYFFGQGQTWVVRGLSRQSPDELDQQIRHHRLRYRVGRLVGRSKVWFPHLVQCAHLEGQRTARQTDKVKR